MVHYYDGSCLGIFVFVMIASAYATEAQSLAVSV